MLSVCTDGEVLGGLDAREALFSCIAWIRLVDNGDVVLGEGCVQVSCCWEGWGCVNMMGSTKKKKSRTQLCEQVEEVDICLCGNKKDVARVATMDKNTSKKQAFFFFFF